MASVLHSGLAYPDPPPEQPVSLWRRIVFLAAVWLLVLTPFLFWHGPWFGRPLSDQQIDNYLHDSNPQHVRHALMQIGERMSRRDPTVVDWYPDLVALAASPYEEVRAADAWVLGQDSTHPEFRPPLHRLLQDASVPVRHSAALSLVQFGDASGHEQIVAMLQPVIVAAPKAGRILEIVRPDSLVREGGLVAEMATQSGVLQIKAPLSGRVHDVRTELGESAAAGAELLTVAPNAEQLWNALRALHDVGRLGDLPAIEPYLQLSTEFPARVRQQAELTEQAIRQRNVP